MNAGELITASFRKLAIRASESSLTEQEKTDALFELNNMMAQYETEGFHLAYTPVSSTSDEITTPEWSHRWMILSLAVLIAPEYGKQPSPVILADLSVAYKAIQNVLISAPRVKLPPDMPIGGGNQGIGQRDLGGRRFVGDQTSEDILTGGGDGLHDENGDQLLQGTSETE